MAHPNHERSSPGVETDEYLKGFRLTQSGWSTALEEGLKADRSTVCVISPFIKRRAAERLLEQGTPTDLRVVTRFKLADFAEGVSDCSALRLLLSHGARVRGVRRLHSKLYLFGSSRAIVTSANLTESALLNNHEFGFVAENAAIVSRCRTYFDFLWERAGSDLSKDRVASWNRKVQNHLARHPRRTTAQRLPDEGVDVESPSEPPPLPVHVDESPQAFVKFFGESHSREQRSYATAESLRDSGCHWACTYPKGKRPQIVEDGAVMFMGWMVEEPNDILIFGRAIGMRYREGDDDATADDIALRPWREQWPHYIRVHHGEFLDGTLANGVSLNLLMETLGADAFAVTQENTRSGSGNTNPRRSYRQQAAVRLSQDGKNWLDQQLQAAFAAHGQIDEETLEGLDWAETPTSVQKLASG
jgi:PLD-like domain